MYEYTAQVLRVVDGDTLVLRVDLGWHVSIVGHVRLRGVNCPELDTASGSEAADYVRGLLGDPSVTVATHKPAPGRSFARYLADVRLPDGSDLADLIVAAGHGARTT